MMFSMLCRILLLCTIPLSLTHCLAEDLAGRVKQQGNLLPYSKVRQLKIGMSKQSVRTLMGDSLIHDPVNENRLDYAYTHQVGARPTTKKYLALTFQHNRLIRIRSSVVPPA